LSLHRCYLQGVHFAGFGICRQNEGHSFDDHLISGAVSVTLSRVIEASIVLWSVCLWLVWVNVQSDCALKPRYFWTFSCRPNLHVMCWHGCIPGT
jgi:hypothetical protein